MRIGHLIAAKASSVTKNHDPASGAGFLWR
jgi:hypothetical protein